MGDIFLEANLNKSGKRIFSDISMTSKVLICDNESTQWFYHWEFSKESKLQKHKKRHLIIVSAAEVNVGLAVGLTVLAGVILCVVLFMLNRKQKAM